MDAESFPYTDRQTTTDNRQQTTDRHARLDKGEAAYGVALKMKKGVEVGLSQFK